MRGIRADGDAIQQIRTAAGLTQEDLATLADCDVRTVRNAERGNNLDPKTLEAIAVALNVTPADLTQGYNARQAANVRTVAAWLEAVSQHDCSRVLALLDEDVVFRLPVVPDFPLGGTLHGKDGFRGPLQAVRRTMSVVWRPGEDGRTLAAGDRVMSMGLAEVTCRANASQADIAAAMMFRLRNDCIIEVLASYDTLRLHSLMNGL